MSDTQQAVREHVLELLGGGQAHADFEQAVADMPAELQGTKPEGAAHSSWELLEHMRIAQWDIVEFSRDPKHKSPEFPRGYWPSSVTPPDPAAWQRSVEQFQAGLKEMEDLVKNPATDLFARIPHGDGQTILREALVLADHNAYHLGELVFLRRLLGAWR